MEFRIITIESQKLPWLDLFEAELVEKIGHFVPLKIKKIRSEKQGRGKEKLKREQETLSILRNLLPSDFVILCDENGVAQSSLKFSKGLVQRIESGARSVTFVVGGAFGVGEELKARANQKCRLSDFTLNHLVARVVLLEQIYRAMMIWKGRPYHNE